jgi:hypothetical protein
MGICCKIFGISSIDDGELWSLNSCEMRPRHSIHDSDFAVACNALTTSRRCGNVISIEIHGKEDGEEALHQGRSRCQQGPEANSYRMRVACPSVGHHRCSRMLTCRWVYDNQLNTTIHNVLNKLTMSHPSPPIQT